MSSVVSTAHLLEGLYQLDHFPAGCCRVLVVQGGNLFGHLCEPGLKVFYNSAFTFSIKANRTMRTNYFVAQLAFPLMGFVSIFGGSHHHVIHGTGWKRHVMQNFVFLDVLCFEMDCCVKFSLKTGKHGPYHQQHLEFTRPIKLKL